MSTIGNFLYAICNQSFIQAFSVMILLGTLACPTSAQEAPRKLLVAYAGLISTHTSVWLG